MYFIVLLLLFLKLFWKMNALLLAFFVYFISSTIEFDKEICEGKMEIFENQFLHKRNICARVKKFDGITGLVLARGSSKGIPAKNLALVGNMTLLSRTLQTAQKFSKFSSIWVSTDDIDIAKEARKNGALVHWRSAESATDTAPSITGVQDFVNSHPEISSVALMQCTSPFLQVSYLTEAYNLMMSKNVDCVFSVTREFKLRWKEVDGGLVEPLNFSPISRPRRQDWLGELVENGMFYFVKSTLVQKGLLQGNRCAVVEIPKYHSIEIDTVHDLQIAQAQSGFHLFP